MKDIAKRVFNVEIESLQHVVELIDDLSETVVNRVGLYDALGEGECDNTSCHGSPILNVRHSVE